MSFLCWILHESEVRNCAFEYLYSRVDFLRNGLQYNHVGEQCRELAIEFHVVVADDVEHADQELHALDIEDALALQNAEEVAQLGLVSGKTAVEDLFALEVGEIEDHVCAFLAVTLDDGFYEVYKVKTVGFV